jgi:hypothetical protein
MKITKSELQEMVKGAVSRAMKLRESGLSREELPAFNPKHAQDLTKHSAMAQKLAGSISKHAEALVSELDLGFGATAELRKAILDVVLKNLGAP